MSETVFDRAAAREQPADRLFDDLKSMRSKGERDMRHLYSLILGLGAKKQADVDATAAGGQPVFSNEEWTLTDGSVNQMLDGYDILDGEGNVIDHQIGLRELVALAENTLGMPDPTPEA